MSVCVSVSRFLSPCLSLQLTVNTSSPCVLFPYSHYSLHYIHFLSLSLYITELSHTSSHYSYHSSLHYTSHGPPKLPPSLHKLPFPVTTHHTTPTDFPSLYPPLSPSLHLTRAFHTSSVTSLASPARPPPPLTTMSPAKPFLHPLLSCSTAVFTLQ